VKNAAEKKISVQREKRIQARNLSKDIILRLRNAYGAIVTGR